MTPREQAEKDLRKVEIHLAQAKMKANVPQSELERLEELLEIRKFILKKLTE